MVEQEYSKRNKLQIMVSDGEQKMLEQLCERFSCNASELVRGYVRDQHKKVFPAYGAGKRIKPIEEAITDEQYCEMVGGKVGRGKEGGSVCFVYKPGTENGRGFPLSERKRIKECAKQFGII